MAGDHPSRGQLPRRDQYDESEYPPVPGEEDERSRAVPPSRPQMASGAVSLPSLHDRNDIYGHLRSWDSRTPAYGVSHTPNHGYSHPPASVPSHPGSSYPPVAANGAAPSHPAGVPSNPGSSYSPVAPNGAIPPPAGVSNPDSRAHEYYAQHPPAPYSAPPYEYPYRQDRYSVEFPRSSPVGNPVISHGQSAPRQRTSIACKYCRRRKIRCSGYANSPGGKCTNCIKMNQECVFQPVSSTSSTAFVPVSALPGGVPPGVTLYGAYGQPLAQQTSYPPAPSYQAAPTQHFDQPSPTNSTGSYWDGGHENGRRRPMTTEDDHMVRLPPPNTFPDDNSVRRSPSNGSPGRLQAFNSSQPQTIPPRQGYDNRPSPPRGSPSGAPASSASGSSVMNLENLMSSNSPGNDIDQNMLGRLNRHTK
ncbi:hypothetical protein GGS21DRAFT_538148 [Xylaria nigripes]|nr:hypothetical protein GGS21DRAFT_538148 [Xylaria nigripes]